MTWNDIISFTDKNTPYRFRIKTERADNSDECKVFVDEIDTTDAVTDQFDFMYNIKQDIPAADYLLHQKPIMTLVSQMLSIKSDPAKW